MGTRKDQEKLAAGHSVEEFLSVGLHWFLAVTYSKGERLGVQLE